MQSFLHNLPRYPEENLDEAKFATNDPEEGTKRRFNSPTRDQNKQRRKYLFLKQVIGQDQPATQYPTSLEVTREMMCCFFGHGVQEINPSRPNREPEDPSGLLLAPSPLLSSQHGVPMEAIRPSPEAAMTDVAQREVTPRDQASSQYSRSLGLSTVGEDIQSEPVDMDPHRSGTPDPPPLLAAGFEDPTCNCSMEDRNYISVRRKNPGILRIWYQSSR